MRRWILLRLTELGYWLWIWADDRLNDRDKGHRS